MKPFVVESPCSESWDGMQRQAGTARHCASCQKSVFDLSRMTERQIHGVVTLTGGSFCGRQVIRDGEMVTRAPDPAPAKVRPAWNIIARGALAAGALATAACEGQAGATPVPEPTETPIVLIAQTDPNPGEPAPRPNPEPPPLTVVDHPEVVIAGGMAPPPTVNDEVPFAAGKADIGQEAVWGLDNVASVMAENPWIAKVDIRAFATASEGKSAKAIAKLAAARAEAIKSYLVKKGIDPNRFHVFSSRGRSANATVRIGQ